MKPSLPTILKLTLPFITGILLALVTYQQNSVNECQDRIANLTNNRDIQIYFNILQMQEFNYLSTLMLNQSAINVNKEGAVVIPSPQILQKKLKEYSDLSSDTQKKIFALNEKITASQVKCNSISTSVKTLLNLALLSFLVSIYVAFKYLKKG